MIDLSDIFKVYGGCNPRIKDLARVTEISYHYDVWGKIKQINLCLTALPETEEE